MGKMISVAEEKLTKIDMTKRHSSEENGKRPSHENANRIDNGIETEVECSFHMFHQFDSINLMSVAGSLD